MSGTKEEQGNEIFSGLHCTLEFIRKQQVESIKKLDCGLRAAAIGGRDETDNDIGEGRVNIRRYFFSSRLVCPSKKKKKNA